MALGLIPKRTDFIPIIKYDARSGLFMRVDRAQNAEGQWQTEETQLKEPEFLCDLGQVEIGWMRFLGVPQWYIEIKRCRRSRRKTTAWALGYC